MTLRIPKIDLHKAVDDLVAQVPEGRVTTYGAVALALGDVVASRYVGKVMSENDDIHRVPCRRVVQSDGRLGGFTGGGTPAKKKALRAEGIKIEGDRIVDFEKVLFNDFKTTRPLRRFRQIQLRDSKRLILRDDFPSDAIMAGSDIAYDGDTAHGALVLLDRKTAGARKVFTVRTKVDFPYIPTFLTFREAPVIERLIEKLDEEPFLVHDGNGIIHPLGFGIASHMGVMLDIPTIGVAKKLLCGSITGNGRLRKVVMNRKHVGYAATGAGGGSPVYVSPGHRISTSSTIKVLKPYWKHRIPEPVRLAHMEAGEARRRMK